MALGDAKLEITGDSSVARREYDKLVKQVAMLREELRKTGTESKKVGDESGKSISAASKLAATVLSSVQNYANVAAVVSGITAEFREQLELQKQLAKFQQGAAGSQRGFLRNLGVVPPAEREAVLNQIRGIAKSTGVPESQLYGAASQATAAKGGLSNQEALKFLAIAAKVAPDDIAEMTATTGGLLDTASLTGSKNPLENLGVLAAIGEQARVTTLKDISENLVPAAIGVKGFGGSTGDAAAMVTTMTQAMKDTTGRMSGTASISLAKQLAEFLPEEDRFSFDSKGKKKLEAKGTGLAETDDRIRALQNDAALREKFLAQATFEAKAIIPSRDLLTKGTATASLFEQNVGGYVSGAAAVNQGQQFIEGLGTTGLQQNAAESRTSEQIAEDLKLKRLEAGSNGAIYNAVSSLMESAGYGGPRRQLTEFNMLLRDTLGGQTTAQAGIETLEHVSQDFDTGPNASQSDRETLKSFREMIALLKSIDDRQKKNEDRVAPGTRVNIDAHTE